MPLQINTKSKSEDQHSADVNTLVYHNEKLYSGADDGKIIVWDKNLNKLNEIQAHPTTLYCLVVGNGSLYSCSNDGAIKSWNLENLNAKEKILQVDEELYRLAFSDGVLYSSDDQGNVRVHKDHIVKGYYVMLEPLREMIVHNNCIYTVRDLDLVLTEIKGEKLFEIKATFPGRAPMCLVDNKLCFSSRSGKDIVIHETTGQTQYKRVCEVKDAHELIINSLVGATVGATTYLYSGSWDKTIKRWKIENDACNLIDTQNVEAVITTMTNGDEGVLYIGCDNGGIVRVDS